MSDGSDDFFKQAEREGRFLHSQGVRTTAHVTAESLGERIPPNSPQPEQPNYTVRMSHPMEEHHPTDIPLKDIAKSDQRRQPVSLNNQATQSVKLEHFPQHEAEQESAKARQPVSMQAGTPAEAQKQGEQEAARAKVLANRETSQGISDQAVSRAAATEKAAEQTKVQQQAPPTQER